MTTPLLALSEIAEGVVNQATIHNTALRQLEALTVRALSMSTTAPPGSPSEGHSYIIPSGATGAWSGKTDQVACFIGGAWSYFTPFEGLRLWVNDEDEEFVFDGAAWVPTSGGSISAHESAPDPHPQYLTEAEGDARYLQTVPAQPFDVTAFYPGIPTASAIVTRIPIARSVTFPAGLTNSVGKASAAATAQTDFDVQKNGVSAGTVRFAAASASATFIAASPITFAAGDVLSIIAPATPDATLANVGIVLAGTR